MTTKTETGQILRGTPLGEMLYALASRSDVRTIVEIGSWLGMGSTAVILSALIDRPYTFESFTTVEASREMFDKAMANWTEAKLLVPGFIPLHGRITDVADLDISNLSITERAWLESDLQAYAACPNVTNRLPSGLVDLAVLDSGEFSGFSEFILLKDRARLLCLDDTFGSRKHRKTREYILSTPKEWEVISDNYADRNGWMIAKKSND